MDGGATLASDSVCWNTNPKLRNAIQAHGVGGGCFANGIAHMRVGERGRVERVEQAARQQGSRVTLPAVRTFQAHAFFSSRLVSGVEKLPKFGNGTRELYRNGNVYRI